MEMESEDFAQKCTTSLKWYVNTSCSAASTCKSMISGQWESQLMYVLTVLSNSSSLANKMVMIVACSSARFKISSFAEVLFFIMQ